MDKREFLKMSGALLAGGMFSNLTADEQQSAARKNWSGNYEYHAKQVDHPASVADIRQLVKKCTKAKPLGTRHSFNSIADTTGDQISLPNLKEMTIDRERKTVAVGAGVRYGDVAPYLYKEGYALHNLASLPHISVAGACATATHGSGNKNGNLATAVSALEIITPDGELKTLSRERDDEQFLAAVVGLGGLGVVTKTTLNLLPAFDMRQVVYENLPIGQLEHHLDEIFGSGYSVSLFTDWQNHRITQVWIKSRVSSQNAHSEMPPVFFGAKLATKNLHPITGHSAENCTEQMGVPGPWYERLPHFRMNFTPSSGDELQSEYFVPREKGYEAILAVEKLRDQITPHLFVTELRTIDADNLWMSTCYQRPSMTIHFTWKPEWAAVKKILPMIEEQLAPFDPRPHWAKLFTMSPERLQARYVKLPQFREMLKQYDPGGKLRNEFLNRNIYGA